ncbi:nitrate reductase molybdenum cofactor assembly chaperone [Staphylococcus debuckii]|uniref:nitrate reductase molybdenum cofactor assembly chaperone n=1 Tax=Staphylococcus debuckii TaxID=2044912 RepID=UPI000F42F6EA|nr:nitrate reductase molybdenum cofactor assembly chaperone [Staphylococcus debuckii]AYU56010.1 nitrate reductase molybdenum cofactor assembly chaperone [Staphylococcus debuckii]
MINLDNFYQYQESIGYFAQQLNFPEKLTFHPKTFNDIFNTNHPAYAEVAAYREQIQSYTLTEIKQLYTDTFDFNKQAPLYMTYNKFDTQKERGQMLAKLKVLYEMFGLEMVDNELSDYLPLMLEFLYVAQWQNDDRAEDNIEFVIMVIEDGTYAMLQQLIEIDSPYAPLIKGLRETLKRCLQPNEEVSQHA